MIAPLSTEVLTELDRVQGGPVQVEDPRNHARYVVIPQEDYQRIQPLLAHAEPLNGDDQADWNEEKNSRRCDLIDKEIAGTLLLDEAIELRALQNQLLAYRRRVAPLPLEDARDLHRELLRKAALGQDKEG
jgi:hypothetical protein